jgi:hypothetical protein
LHTYRVDSKLDPIDQRAAFDVTELIDSRSSDHVYFNIRLSGGYADYIPNVFGTLGAHHTVTLAASEFGSGLSSRLPIDGPFAAVGNDRKVLVVAAPGGTGPYDPSGAILSSMWSLECHGNTLRAHTDRR